MWKKTAKNYVVKSKNTSLHSTFLSSCCCLFYPAVLSSGSGLEGELFGMGMWSLGLGAVGAALAGIFLANTDLCLPKAANASMEYLEDTDLRSTIDGRLAFLLSVS